MCEHCHGSWVPHKALQDIIVGESQSKEGQTIVRQTSNGSAQNLASSKCPVYMNQPYNQEFGRGFQVWYRLTACLERSTIRHGFCSWELERANVCYRSTIETRSADVSPSQCGTKGCLSHSQPKTAGWQESSGSSMWRMEEVQLLGMAKSMRFDWRPHFQWAHYRRWRLSFTLIHACNLFNFDEM